jgi:hypothetical protein
MAITRLGGANAITGTLPAANINDTSIGNITALPAGVGGKVLQIQQVQTSTQTAINGTTWTDIGGLELTITPIISSSKFFITCDVAFRLETTASLTEPNSNLRFTKDGSALFTEVTWGGFSLKSASARTDTFGLIRDSRNFLDTNSHTTSNIVYKVQGVTEGSNEKITFNESNITSRLLVMEIA